MQIRVRSFDLEVRPCRTRLPFRFGAATLTAAPLLTARVEAEIQGDVIEGRAGDWAMPMWFDKDPSRTPEQSSAALIESANEAGAAFAAQAGGTAFDLWRAVYDARVGATPFEAPDRLVRGFGVALFERALIDAAARAAGVSFHEALRGNLLGFAPGEVHPELAEWDLAADLPAEPAATLRLRHTVGGLDPLRAEDVPEQKRVEDGLPVALDQDIASYGLTSFKIKLGGDPRADARRLFDLSELLAGRMVHEVTLDANEQYADLKDLARVLDVVATTDEGQDLLAKLVFIEQPLDRAGSFDPALTADIAALPVPVILDEADHGVEAFPKALDLGYGGVSVKNCKGVFRALINRGLCAVRGGFQSAEDLTNVPILPLHQDLATVAALGLEHVERNGHHYFRGLDHLSVKEREAALLRHGDLYVERDGLAQLRIEDGLLQIASLEAPGYASEAAHAV